MKTNKNPLANLMHPVKLATVALGIASQSQGVQGTARYTNALAPSGPAPAPAPTQLDYCQIDHKVNANWVDACQTFKVRPDAPAPLWPTSGPRLIRSYGTSELPPCELTDVAALLPDSQPDVPVTTSAVYPRHDHGALLGHFDGVAFDRKCEDLKQNVATGCKTPVDMC